MQVFKTRAFARWASGEGLEDDALVSAVAEMGQGLIDARLGGQVVNERANVGDDELKALKLLAKELLSYPPATLARALDAGELIEIEVNDDG